MKKMTVLLIVCVIVGWAFALSAYAQNSFDSSCDSEFFEGGKDKLTLVGKKEGCSYRFGKELYMSLDQNFSKDRAVQLIRMFLLCSKREDYSADELWYVINDALIMNGGKNVEFYWGDVVGRAGIIDDKKSFFIQKRPPKESYAIE